MDSLISRRLVIGNIAPVIPPIVYNIKTIVDETGKRILNNSTDKKANLTLNSGGGIFLNSNTQTIDIPIHALHGNELVPDSNLSDMTKWNNDNGTWSIENGVATKNTNKVDKLYVSIPFEKGKTYEMTVDIASGYVNFSTFAGKYTYTYLKSGINKITYTATITKEQIVSIDSRLVNTVVNSISVKEVIETRGSITTLNYNNNKFEQIAHDGIDSMELCKNNNFKDGFKEWDYPVKPIDIIDDRVKINVLNYTMLKQQRVDLLGKTVRVTVDVLTDNADVYQHINNKYINNGINTTGVLSYVGKLNTYNIGFGVNRTGVDTIFANPSIKELLPLASIFKLKNGNYGIIIKLHDSVFSKEDLDLFTKYPEIIIEWYFGRTSIPSGIIRTVNDKVFANMENDKYLFEMSFETLPTDRSQPYAEIDGTDNTIVHTDNKWIVNINNKVKTNGKPNMNYSSTFTPDQLYKITITVNVTDGYTTFRNINYGLKDGTPYKTNINKQCVPGNNVFTFYGNLTNAGIVSLTFNNSVTAKAHYTVKMDIERITSDYLVIKNYNKSVRANINDNSRGLQKVLLDMNSSNVPIGNINDKLSMCNGGSLGNKYELKVPYTIEYGGIFKIPILGQPLEVELYTTNTILKVQIENGIKLISKKEGNYHYHGITFLKDKNSLKSYKGLIITFTAEILYGSKTLDKYHNGVQILPLPNGPHKIKNGVNTIVIGPVIKNGASVFPNISEYSEIVLSNITIKEIIGYEDTVQERILTNDGENIKYYIKKDEDVEYVEQNDYGTLPTELVLNNRAFIGHNEEVISINKGFKLYKEIKEI